MGKSEINDWVEKNWSKWLERINDEGLLELADTFLSQFVLQAVKLLNLSRVDRFRSRINVVKGILFHPIIHPKFIQIDKQVQNINIVFSPFQKSHWNTHKYVVNELKEKSIIITTNKPLTKRIEKIGVSYFDISLKRKLTFNWQLTSIALKIMFLKVKNHDSAKVIPVSFKELFLSALSSWYHLLHEAEIAAETIIKLNPKVCVIGNDQTVVGRYMSKLLKKEGIKTYVIMHGSIDSFLCKKMIADRFLVYGERDKKLLKLWGIDIEKVLVVGSPQIDHLINKERKVPEKRIQQFLEDKKAILIATSGPGHSVSEPNHRLVCRYLMDLAKTRMDYHFIVKLHRKDRRHFYEEENMSQKEKLPKNVAIIEYQDQRFDNSIYEWLILAKAMISVASSAIYDAIVMDKPVITIDPLNECADFDAIEKKITIHNRNFIELKKNFDSLLDDHEVLKEQLAIQKEYKVDCFANHETGDASKIIAKKLLEASLLIDGEV